MFSCGMASLRKLSFYAKIFMVLIALFITTEIVKVVRTPGRPRFFHTDASKSVPYGRLADATQGNLYVHNNERSTKSTRTSLLMNDCELPVEEKPQTLARRFPHIIIIGFGKAGTRALYQMIRMHPDIVGPTDEIRFFSKDKHYNRGLRSYIRLLPISKTSQKTIVKSPDYIISLAAAIRLQRALAYCKRSEEIKFIVVLRDPFTRAVSEYLHYKIYLKQWKKKELKSFEKMSIRKSGQVNNLNQQVNASIYSYHLENWIKYFDLKKICFVNGEGLVKDPYSEVSKLEKCLGLRTFIQPQHFIYNRVKGFYCPIDSRGVAKCLGSAKGRRHPQIEKETEQKLRQFYQPFNNKLYNITGVNYNWTVTM